MALLEQNRCITMASSVGISHGWDLEGVQRGGRELWLLLALSQVRLQGML